VERAIQGELIQAPLLAVKAEPVQAAELLDDEAGDAA
jgi:hypothetical protein